MHPELRDCGSGLLGPLVFAILLWIAVSIRSKIPPKNGRW